MTSVGHPAIERPVGGGERQVSTGQREVSTGQREVSTGQREVSTGQREVFAGQRQVSERAARRTLAAQVARLERELSAVVARGFPHIPTPRVDIDLAPAYRPRLLTLGELERQRDELAAKLRVAHLQRAERADLEQRSRALLREMQREPRRHKFVRLAFADLGERGCGVWRVRPRLGLIGMLAGWWEVKLSSGCP
jgi:molybdopterin-guanine dinucleotide biosynthesis protein